MNIFTKVWKISSSEEKYSPSKQELTYFVGIFMIFKTFLKSCRLINGYEDVLENLVKIKTKSPYISVIIPRKSLFSSILAALSSVFFLGELTYLGLTGSSPGSSSPSRGFSGDSSVTSFSYEKYSVSHLSSSNLSSLGMLYTSMSKSLKYFTFGNLILQTSLLGKAPN